MSRRLRVTFKEAAVFREEYERNIFNGGAFIRTAEEFQPRDLVEVELELGFCGESVVVDAEIVQSVRAEQAGSEAADGVAVQFLEPASVLRERLERFVEESVAPEAESAEPAKRAVLGEEDLSGVDAEDLPAEKHVSGPSEAPCLDPSEVDLLPSGEMEDPPAAAMDRRKAPRVRTRVQARVDARSMSLEGRTRDLSETGVLISADASGLPVGKAVKLELAHPLSGEPLEVEGAVSRHVETEGTVAAVGIEFGQAAASDELAAFLEDVNQAEKELKGTGIYGAIEELGMVALVRMLGMSASQGTLTIISGVEDGSIDFENGMLRCARLGELRGVKALSRFLSWEKGSFEFHARLGPADDEPDAIALEDAIQEAIRQREDLIQAELTGVLDPASCFTIDAEMLRGESGLSKTQEAVLDLVAASFSVRRILDVIPQPDAEVIEALNSLLDGEIIRPV
jgi:Tfp pilus assembly protein PilZ